jgi:hypothetical protein
VRVLFLDIDGVLNAGAFSVTAESSSLDAAAVERLNGILTATGAKLVLSSSWRYLILGGSMTVEGFEYLLRTHGVTKGCLIDHTCADEATAGRGRQILRWLEEHGAVEAWAVVDDLAIDDLGAERWRHVRTDARVGLSAADAATIVRILLGDLEGLVTGEAQRSR